MIASQQDNGLANAPLDVFVARQPIFRRNLQVYGYELLYRGNLENSFDGTPADIATSRVITNAFLTIGAEKLLNGKPAFINFDSSLLTSEYASLVPFQSAVVEILESVVPTADVLAACRQLKSQGYTLALDDCTDSAGLDPWLDLVDIVKVDFLGTDARAREKILAKCRARGIETLAEKLEARADFEHAAALGYDYYQGFFFARPVIVKGRAIPDAKLMVLELLREVTNEELNFERIERLMQRNVSLVYKLLRFVNSAVFGWRSKITSVRHAMGLLGEQELRKWVCLLLVGTLGQDTVPELVVHSLVRARFGEFVAPRMGLGPRKESAFLLGLLSNLDVLLNRPMEEAISELNLEDDLSAALLRRSCEQDALARLYALIQAYEATDSPRIRAISEEFGIPASYLTKAYVQAVEWADNVSKE